MSEFDQAVNHLSNDECRESFLKAFEDTTKEPNWMAAVWCVEKGRIEIVRLTTSHFMNGDFTIAIALLANKMHEFVLSSAQPKEPDPLPVANVKPWCIGLYNGDQVKGDEGGNHE